MTPSDPEDTGVIPLIPIDPPTVRGAVRMALVCVSGEDVGKSFRVTMAPAVIGRGNVDIALAETDVSRRHARFSFGELGFQIEDLESANGTLLNGARVTGKVPVHVGDRLQVGRSVLVFSQHDELAERVARMQRLEGMATLAGGIAHDFNNALAIVMCNLEFVAEALPPDATLARESMAEIRAATTSATTLARRLLRLGRSEPLSFGQVALEPLAKQTAAMACRRARAPIAYVIDVPPDLRALASHDEIHQAVLNLCLNACDAMPDGGRLTISGRNIQLATEAALARQVPIAGDFVELSVTDTGCGMDEATLARAFEPFFTTKPRDKGTGLGLAMIHTSVRRHGGAVEVESTVGRGTTFRLTLPRWSSTAAAPR